MLEKRQQLYQRICTYKLDDLSHEIGFLGHLIRAKDGQEKRDRFHDLYPVTIRSYRQHFGRDLQMQCGRIRRPFKPWRGWRSWLR
jgi:hypothetical protein